ncbi:MAG: TolC family protein [Ferruginibacter sp.]
MKNILLLLTAFFLIQKSKAADSVKTLSLPNFLQIVKRFHPVAKQAFIQVDKAKAGLTIARGNFDPILSSSAGNKTFDGINYYQSNATQLSVPVWYGIELTTGIEYLSGGRTDPTETIGKTSFTGISIPLAKNLLMDKRRATLQQATIMIQASEQEQKILLNNLMMDATEAYWQWVQACLVYNIYNSGIFSTT